MKWLIEKEVVVLRAVVAALALAIAIAGAAAGVDVQECVAVARRLLGLSW